MRSSDVVIAGVGMTPFGRFPERSVRSLASEAVRKALRDASLDPPAIGAIFFSNAAGGILHAQEMIAGQSALRHEGFEGTAVYNVENACASASSAFSLAVMAVASGQCEIAMAVGAEKLTHPDKRRSVTALSTASDLEEDPEARSELSRALLGWDDSPVEGRPSSQDRAGSIFMEIYAQETKEYMAQTGATAADLAVIAAKNHGNGAKNEFAQFRRPLSPEDVLASRIIYDPLTLFMCSPIGDGAAAVVVSSAEHARRTSSSPVMVRSVSVASGLSATAEPSDINPVVRASTKAYEQASVDPVDIDVIEVHDAAAPGELFAYEDLALCPKGEGPRYLASGAPHIGGRQPVNPSGGLIARGHPIGATGCAQLVELVEQLRGLSGGRQVDGARLAMAQNSGGNLGDGLPASCVVTILERI